MNTLKEVPVGKSARVVKLHGEGAIKRRIMDMGITKGVEVFVRKVAPLGDPWKSPCAAMSSPCAKQMRKWSRWSEAFSGTKTGFPPVFSQKVRRNKLIK